jgi:hypothetical protein
MSLFLTALSLKAGFAEVVDLRHSVEPQDLSDCCAPLLVAPVSGGEENGLYLFLEEFQGLRSTA